MKYIDSYKATQTGLFLVVFSALLFLSIGFITSYYFVINFDFHPLLSILLFPSLSLVIYMPLWSFILAKWKIWSFRRIDDIEILIKLAESKHLIFPDDHFYTKYEVCSKRDKMIILELKKLSYLTLIQIF